MDLQDYLNSIEGKLQRKVGKRESKVEKEIYKLVVELFEKKEPATIKRISEALGKKPQQIHQVVKKSDRLLKSKVKGFTIITPNEDKVAPEEEQSDAGIDSGLAYESEESNTESPSE